MEAQDGQLSRIVIRGFKSIQNCDIELNRINIMIGSNGAGKSNFISAFDTPPECYQQEFTALGANKRFEQLILQRSKGDRRNLF